MEFEIMNAPHDNRVLYKNNKLTLERGVNILVGANGTGKTSLLNILKKKINKRMHDLVDEDELTPVSLVYFDNLHQGGHGFMDKAGFFGDMSSLAAMFCSSEGEGIHYAFGNEVAKAIGQEFKRNAGLNEFYVLIDAVDSGLSVDLIDDIKDFFKFVQEQNPNVYFYFVMSSNNYATTINERCIDITTFEEVKFNDYKEYRDFIYKTRKYKDESINNAEKENNEDE